MKTDALKVVILLLILALCFLLFLGVRAQAQETNDQVVLVFDRIENGKIILTPKVGVYFTVKADTFVPLKRGDFIICRERTLDATDERVSGASFSNTYTTAGFSIVLALFSRINITFITRHIVGRTRRST